MSILKRSLEIRVAEPEMTLFGRNLGGDLTVGVVVGGWRVREGWKRVEFVESGATCTN